MILTFLYTYYSYQPAQLRTWHPGTGMSYKLSPLMPSELVADCFELARDVRALDMQASPYDVSELGYPPVMVETAEGRAEYVRQQREFSERAAVLRGRLIDACSAALDLADQVAGNSADWRHARR